MLTSEDIYGKRKYKYGNKFIEVDGHKFPSQNEANRYLELKLLLKAGEIKDLRLQVPFELQPSFKNEITGEIEKPIKYVADFVYTDKDGNTVIEDAKSEGTRKDKVYQLKRKIMAYQGNYIVEVET